MRTYIVNRVIDRTVELCDGSLESQTESTAIAVVNAPSRRDADVMAREAFPGDRLDLNRLQPHNQTQQRVANDLPRI
jgi:hypothetical protein